MNFDITFHLTCVGIGDTRRETAYRHPALNEVVDDVAIVVRKEGTLVREKIDCRRCHPAETGERGRAATNSVSGPIRGIQRPTRYRVMNCRYAERR